MASVTLTITDRPGGELTVAFKGDGLKTASTINQNSTAQNAAIALAFWMKENGLGGDTVPDLESDSAFKAWMAARGQSS